MHETVYKVSYYYIPVWHHNKITMFGSSDHRQLYTGLHCDEKEYNIDATDNNSMRNMITN